MFLSLRPAVTKAIAAIAAQRQQENLNMITVLEPPASIPWASNCSDQTHQEARAALQELAWLQISGPFVSLIRSGILGRVMI